MDVRLVRSEDPHLREAPVEALSTPVTPPELHFVRSHGVVPDTTGWSLTVDGSVDTPLTLGLDDLAVLPQHEVTAVCECAGNGRKHFAAVHPEPVEGDPWGAGAVSCSAWSGPRLVELLARAGVGPGAVDLACVGASTELHDGEEGFTRGLPLPAALSPDTIVAVRHGGEPLTPPHGAPARLVVPGLHGVAWVKWLTRLRVLDCRWTGYWNTHKYVLRRPGAPDQVIERLGCKAVLTTPQEGDTVGGEVAVRGVAWSGWGRITAVDLSDDGGRTWTPAELDAPASPYAWTPFSATWRPRGPGGQRLRARATDVAGRVQPAPEEVVWNVEGYLFDGCVDVEVQVSR